MTYKEAQENTKFVLTLREVCEHAWCVDCLCHLECQADECFAKSSDEQIDCMCKYFLQKNFDNENTR